MNDHQSKARDRQATVAVYGAGGHTGRFVIAELLRRGFAAIAIGRDAASLAAAGFPAGVTQCTAVLDDPASLDRALAGADAVVNCAGPFLDTADQVVSAALRAAIPYFDVAAEQASAQATFEHHATAAEEAGVTVIPAMGFYGGLGDLLATAAMDDWTSADEIRIGIALDSWRPTAGTRITGRRNTARRLTISEGKLGPLPDPAPTLDWRFAAPFGVQDMVEVPFTETILIGRHLQAGEVHNYLNTAPLRDLRDASTPAPTAADGSGRSAQTFRVEAEARQGGAVRRASAQGRDIYAFTAPLVVEAVERVLNSPMAPGGVFAPGARFDAADFLAALGPHLMA